VADAESKGDVGYLASAGTPEAIGALGRLADKNPKAQQVVESRAENDLNAYIAAWDAVQRGAPWGTALIKSGLRDPARAETAAAPMKRGDPKLTAFVPDFSDALVAAGTKEARVTVAAMLASTAASSTIEERLKDKSTRANMCRGLASPDASSLAKRAFLVAPAESRDDPACVDTVVRYATIDDATMGWLAQAAEPGLLSGAGKSDTMPCPRLAQLWTDAIGKRPASAHASLAVPLAHAIKRCPTQMDGVLEAALVQTPAAVPLVIQGVDPYGPETSQLAKTCKAMPGAMRFATGRNKDRAADTLSHGCKKPGR
jgi:hypothetical protein